MKKALIYIVLAIGIVACGTKETSKDIINPVEVKVAVTPDAKVEFSDPARMGGSSFGEFFISMLRTQNYDMALKFTSKGSIEKFGVEKIMEKYKNFSYNYKLTQKSMVKDGDTITLSYATNEMATGKLKKMTVVIENDSCKLILSNLDKFPE